MAIKGKTLVGGEDFAADYIITRDGAASVEPGIRSLSTGEIDAVAGAAVRYYVMGGTWWVCGTNRNGDPCAVNTGIAA